MKLNNLFKPLLAAAILQSFSVAAAEPYDFGKVQGWLETTFERTGYDGMGMLVWKDGEVVFEKYFGNYNSQTRLPIASATKWLSGAAVMSLVDDGLISLDDPLSKHLPAFSGDKAAITIRQAFSHTSGLGNLEGGWQRTTPTGKYADNVAEAPLAASPGTELRYASESMQVVGAIAEKVTGKRWEVLFRERITEPLGMSQTGFSQTGDAVNPMLAGGAGSNISDYARFLTMLIQQGRYDGVQVLSKAAVRVMHANQSGGVPVTRGSRDRMERQSQYGIGNWCDVLDAKGDTNVSSSPGAFGTRPWIDWDRNLFAIFFIDRRTAKHDFSPDPYELIDLVRAAVD